MVVEHACLQVWSRSVQPQSCFLLSKRPTASFGRGCGFPMTTTSCRCLRTSRRRYRTVRPFSLPPLESSNSTERAVRYMRLMAMTAIAPSLVVFCISSFYDAGRGHQRALKQSKLVEPSAIEALRAIPLHDGIVLTNELRYDRNISRLLPLLNTWAPAIFGHPFWSNNFILHLQSPSLVERS
jgi:hypothetical protein